MTEILFKAVFAILLIIQGIIGRRFRRGYRSGEGRIARHAVREKILYYLVGSSYLPIGLYVSTAWLDGFHIPLSDEVRWIGAILFAAGDALLYWSHRALGRNWSPVLEIRKEHRLVTEGPYRYVRHPMYSGIFLTGIGMAVLSANSIVAVWFLGTVTVMYVVRVASEEEMLLEYFGEEYRAYMRRTGRLFPLHFLRHSRTG